MNKIEQLVIEWANERGLIKGTTIDKQFKKLIEEIGELSRALMLEDMAGTIDGIGDCMVVLTNMANKLGTSLGECYQAAYNEIKDRKGQMVNGTFVKEKK